MPSQPSPARGPTLLRRVLIAAFGLMMIAGAVVPSTFAAPPTAPVRSYLAFPTPTPIPGIPKHG
jgi:hypothetical protein